MPVVAFGQTLGAQPVTALWQQLLVAATGPAVAAVLGGVVAALIVQRFQHKREAAQIIEQNQRSDDEREAADRLRDHDLKMHLIEEMSSAAGGLYFALQHYWRPNY